MYNKITLIGYLGRDAEEWETRHGQVYVLQVATQHKGETTWHRVDFPNPGTAKVTRYLTAGTLVHVEGRLESIRYTNRHGHQATFYKVVADKLHVLRYSREQEEETPEDINKRFPGDPRLIDFDQEVPF